MDKIVEFLLSREIFIIWVAVMGVLIASGIKKIMKVVWNKKHPDIAFNAKKYEYLYAAIAFIIEATTITLMSIYYYQITDWQTLTFDGGIYGLSTSGVYMILQALRKLGKLSKKQIATICTKIGLIIINWYKLYKEKKLTVEKLQADISALQNKIDTYAKNESELSAQGDISAQLKTVAAYLGVDPAYLEMLKKLKRNS